MLSSLLGIRLVLLMGEQIPRPVPDIIAQAVQAVSVTDSLEGNRGFQLTLTLNKNRQVDYPLLKHPLLQPFTRVVVAVVLGAKLDVLMDGILDYYQVNAGQGDGNDTVTVFGKDLTTLMTLQQQNRSFGNQAASTIVQQILNDYRDYILNAEITTTQDQNTLAERIPQQTGTDLDMIQALAQQHGFVFYVEPKTVGINTAYWGPRDRLPSLVQPALTTNFGASDTVRSLQLSHNTLAPVNAEVTIQEPTTGQSIPVPIPTLEDVMGRSLQLTPARRTETTRDTARQSVSQALLTGTAIQANAPNAIQVSGELDTVRYGHVLRVQRTVGVRGVGLSFDGEYRVDQVTHQIRQGQYTQSFSLSRKGLGANRPLVMV